MQNNLENLSIVELYELSQTILQDIKKLKQQEPENKLHGTLEKMALILSATISHDMI